MTTILTPTLAERNRAAAGLNLAVRHLSERQEKHIIARQCEGKLCWLVESQTTPGKFYHVLRVADGWQYDSCDCQDATHRHTPGGCKHRRAVDAIAPVEVQPAPTRRTRYEREEEV